MRRSIKTISFTKAFPNLRLGHKVILNNFFVHFFFIALFLMHAQAFSQIAAQVGKPVSLEIAVQIKTTNYKSCRIAIILPNGEKIYRVVSEPEFKTVYDFTPQFPGRNAVRWEGEGDANLQNAPAVGVTNALNNLSNLLQFKQLTQLNLGCPGEGSIIVMARASVLNTDSPTSNSSTPSNQNNPESEEKFWNLALSIGNKEGFNAYLESYPRGRYVSLARAYLAKLNAPSSTQSINSGVTLAYGTVLKDCPDCPELVVLPPGKFLMGANPGEEEKEKLIDALKNKSQPQHEVNITSLAFGKHEITVAQFKAFVNSSGYNSGLGCTVWTGSKLEFDNSKDWRNPGFNQDDNHPVSCISWDDANAYVRWISQRTGKNYRLPNESEWEYAARSNTNSSRYFSEDNSICSFANVSDLAAKTKVSGSSTWTFANCDDRYAYTAPIGSYRPNIFGLYDMLGNVWEWTQDCWNEDYIGAPRDGSSWSAGDCNKRVIRGGSWYNNPQFLRSAFRVSSNQSIRNFNFGFRVLRSP